MAKSQHQTMVVKAGKGSIKAKMACSGEVEDWGMSPELVKKGDRLIAYDGGEVERLREMPRAPSNKYALSDGSWQTKAQWPPSIGRLTI